MKGKNIRAILILSVFTFLTVSYLNLNLKKYDYVTSNKVNSEEISNLFGFYIQDNSSDTGYSKSDTIPAEGYAFNEVESYCAIDGTRNDSISLTYDAETKMLTVSPMTASGTKCYLYFDERVSVKDSLLTYYPTVLTRTDFSTTVTDSTTGTIYKSADTSQYDEDGEVYYYAGAPTDNWVSFAGYYWRIIRLNGDGTLKLIYAGTSTTTSGTDDQIGTSAFNSSYDYSYYVGLSYSTTQHGTGTSSTILTALNNWYSGLSSTYQKYIDSNAGFCSDRNTASGDTWVASGTSFDFAAYERLRTNKSPSLDCSTSDILNIPVGLITADEVAYAGGVYGASNSSYYLYTNQYYWTMSPSNFSGSAWVFGVISSGGFNDVNYVGSTLGIRPVINLRSDVIITSGNGTATSPFQIG